MLPKLKKYDKDFDFSYTYGTYPTLDLLKLRRSDVLEVIINPDAQDNDIVQEIISMCDESEIPVLISAPLIEKLSVKENTYAIGVFQKYKTELEINKNHVMLVNPSNMGNMGTIIRPMVGFGIHNLALISPAADIFDPKVLRSTMGAFFKINFQHFANIEDYQSEHKNHLYSFMLDAKFEIAEVKFEQPFTLIFGNEGAGLPENYRDISDTIYIKHSSDIDSLNLSICAGIALFRAQLTD